MTNYLSSFQYVVILPKYACAVTLKSVLLNNNDVSLHVWHSIKCVLAFVKAVVVD